MNARNMLGLDRLPFLLLVCLLGFVPLACDDSKGTSSSDEPIETNFGIGLAAVIAADGVPDSVLAIVLQDGVATDTLHLDLSKRTEAGVVRFPVEAPEGVKLLVAYRAYRNGDIVAMGQVSWVSGEAPFIPRPNLAPRIAITGKENAIVRRGHPFVLRASSSDTEKALSSLVVDWNGDGILDDSVVPPKGQDSIRIVWNDAGRYKVSAWVRDDQGMRRRDTLSVLVVPAAQIAISRDTTVSVNDSVEVLVSMSYDDPAQAQSTGIFWSVDGDTSTTAMVQSRKSSWSETGTRRVVAVARDQAGDASRDTMLIHVVQDAPRLDLGDFPRLVDLGAVATLPVGVEQSHGIVVRWGMDFDGDTANGWDTVHAGPLTSVQHLFGRPGQAKVHVFVVDDDSNRTIGSGTVSVSTSNTGAVLQRDSRRDTTISIGDSMVVRFSRSFPEGFEAQSKVEWIEGTRRDTLPVAIGRSFAWADPGTHAVAWRVTSPLGSTAWDTIYAQVVRDAPVLDLSGLPTEAGLNAPLTFSPLATQAFGSIVRWGMDFDGDTANGWDTVRQGKIGSMVHVFSRPDTAKVLLFVDDDDGNHVVGSREILVSSLGTDMLLRRSASVQKASIGDTVAIRFGENFPLGTRNQAKLVWRVDTLAPDTLAIDTVRRFTWPNTGSHVVATKVVGPYGTTSWDTTRIEIVLDAPVVLFEMNFDTVAVDDQTMIAISTSQEFGRIVSWAVDFDGDTTDRWDSTGTGTMPIHFAHSFPAEGEWLVLARVRDDDDNVGTASRRIQARKGAYGLVQRAVSADTTVSIGDKAWVRLRLGGALETQIASSRLEWKVDSALPETLGVADTRSFSWSDSGDHVVRFRALGLFGATGWDSLRIHVVNDPPVIDLSGVSSTIAVNELSALRISASRKFGRIVAWAVDFDGDTTSRWDTTGTGTLPSQFEHCYPVIGTNILRVRVRDDDGNTSSDTMTVSVTTGAYWIIQRVGSPDTTMSIRDSAKVSLRVGSVLQNQFASSRLEWRIDTAASETLAVSDVRGFRWDEPGDHVVRFRALGTFGVTGWDSVVFRIVRGEPGILSISRTGIGVGKTITFSVASDPVFGRIVRERWDFGDDGTWDDSTTIPGEITEHVFPTSAPVSIRVQVTDDDGNGDDSVFVFAARNAAPVFGAAAFTDPTVGLTMPVRLRCSFTDPDGNADLSTLAVDWNNDGTWDTTRNISGLAGEEFVRSFATAGGKIVVLRLVDNSGETAFDTAKIVVSEDAPRLAPLHTLGGGAVARIGDTLWFVAPISDPSNPADLDSATWIRDGMNDTTVSLRGSSVIDMKVPVFSRNVGQHSLKVIVKDRVGNMDSASATWSVAAAPPFALARMSNVYLTSRDTAHLIIDSLRPGSMGGRIKSVSWAFKGSSTWNVIPAPIEGGMVSLKVPNLRDSLWYIAVKTVQDNGEVSYDTARSDILNSFIDKRDGKLYPVIEAGGLEWMGRNLDHNFISSLDSALLSSCGNDNCPEMGRYYTRPTPLKYQVSPKGLSHVVSVCPDGWRLPTEADFSAMRADGFRRGGWQPASMLRSRFGWTNPATPQDDPLRFGAKPTGGYGANQDADWWIYDPEPWTESWRYPRMTLNQELNTNGTGDNSRLPIRCVRLTGILVDSSFMRADLTIDTSIYNTISFKAYLPDSTAPVEVRIGYKGQTSSKSVAITDFQLNTGSFSIPSSTELGRSLALYEIEQNGVVWKDSQYLTAYARFNDERGSGAWYGITRIGNQRWLTKDVDYDGVGYKLNGDFPFAKAKHYEIDSMFLGSAPENGPAAPTQGICPDGTHIPSKAEWDELFAAVTADGLDPNQALRNGSSYYAPSWSYPIQPGTDAYGFDAFPSGYYDNGSWNGGSFYIAADGNGYGLMSFDDGSGGVGYLGPFPKSDFAGYAFNVRCVGN